MLDNGDSAILERGSYYDLSAAELARARKYVIMTFVATAPAVDPIGVIYLPVKGNPANGDIPVFSSADGAFEPAVVSGVSGGPYASVASVAGKADQADLDAAEADASSALAAVNVVREAPLNIKDSQFAGGATMDGTTNDTAASVAIQALAATATKSEIYLPPGILHINTTGHTISPRTGLTVFGAGRGATTVKVGASGTSNPFNDSGLGVVGFEVRDLMIDCNNRGVIGIRMVEAIGPKILNVGVVNANTAGVSIRGCIKPVVDQLNVQTVGSTGVGLWLFDGTYGGRYTNIDISDTTSHGIALDAGTVGGVIGVTADDVHDNTFEGVHIAGSDAVGLLFEGATHNTFTNVIVDGCGAAGLPGIGYAAVQFNQDQSTITSDDNIVTGLMILNSPSTPLLLRNASRNKVQALIDGVGRGGDANPAVFYYAFTSG
ncbi:MAG TPA: hypothetical protein VEX37_08965, partial [Thermomicrobiales bacterium]|nr:hypothetical protein [Thermomicrobiales bacterium]